MLGRLGSDEFALLMPALDRERAREAADAVRQSLGRPFWKDQVIAISLTVGLAVAPSDGVLRDELTRRAYLALRSAKQRGPGSVVCYAPEMEAELKERRFVKREIARALAARAFEVHYQPIVRAEDSAVTGVEALLRWHHPTRGFVPPSLFVPVAEEAGLMQGLGELVLRRAIADATRWPQLYVSVNLSPVQVRDRAFANLLAAVLKETGFEPSRLVLEMTESVLIHNPDETRARLMELRALGVQLALDDFGVGLFQPERSAEASLRQTEDRSGLRGRARSLGQWRRDHPGDRRARPRVGHGGRHRGGGNGGAARTAAPRGLQRDAGLLVCAPQSTRRH